MGFLYGLALYRNVGTNANGCAVQRFHNMSGSFSMVEMSELLRWLQSLLLEIELSAHQATIREAREHGFLAKSKSSLDDTDVLRGQRSNFQTHI